MPRRDPDAARAILDAVRRLVRDVHIRSRESERRAGVGAAQLFVLAKLAESPAASVNELAERTLTHQSSVSVVVAKLERRGLLRRGASLRDGRRRELSLTAAGKRLLRTAPDSPGQRIADALARLPQRDVKKLARLLDALLSEMGVASAVRAPLFDERTT